MKRRKVDGNCYADYSDLPSGSRLDEIIMKAKVKPPYVSYARWKIELERRKDKKRYDCCAPCDYYRYTGKQR